ncbi:hypothetical protein BCR43DRAFT_491133 [Syncephalastrum racemosum]|uniref:RING-type E3 ubiquitin transferase n=1 Tax=Syncephalastrum racemosum TaxID=13706 RepID=A0A1X2HBK3_SYNRA|nr:hypothetical protein BCR43DRAFT_491133 [Syncephalastrum racemosum]
MESTSSLMEPSQPDPDSDPRSEDNHATVSDNTHDNTLQPSTTAEQDNAQSQPQDSPCITERKRSQFSYDASELRRRHIHKTENKDKEQDEHATMNGGGFYECNICFDTATHPVLTVCGHLFCWSCLAQWLHAQARNPTCPVCKAGCGKDKVIPVYGRGREEKDPRLDPSIPTRPAGQRPAPLRDPNTPASSIFGQPLRGAAYTAGNVSISAGIGLFPFGVTFNIPTNNATGVHGQSPQSAFMSRLILMVLCLLIVAIIFY